MLLLSRFSMESIWMECFHAHMLKYNLLINFDITQKYSIL